MSRRVIEVDRKDRILQHLRQAGRPVTGSELARVMGVSRQVIVQDIAILRAQGKEILATPQGYLWRQTREDRQRAVLPVVHPFEKTATELTTLVDHGLKVLDVIVEHPIYGELRGLLMLECRRDVERFLSRAAETNAALLSSLTGGVHLHTVEYSREEDLEAARQALAREGILLT